MRLFENKVTRVYALVFAVLLTLHILPVPSAIAAGTVDRTLSIRIRGEPETLDWNRAHTLVEASLLMNLMEGLVSFDSQLKVVPALAQSWTLSRDHKTYTFKLRSGVRWSDGIALKAKDFVYSWKRLLSPLTAAAYHYFLFDIVGAEAFYRGKLRSFDGVGIKAPDDQTLVVTLIRPVAHWITIPAFWVTFPLRQDIVEEYGPEWEAPGRMVNLGPYSLVSHNLGSRVVFKANPNYYGKRGNVTQVIAQVIKDDAEAVSLFEAGKLDFLTDISGASLSHIRKKHEFKSFPRLKTGYLGFVVDKYPISNLKLRRAIAMAIDHTALSGQAPAQSFVPPLMLGHSKGVGLPFNPAQARQELQNSGLDLTRPLKLDYLLPDWDTSMITAKSIQAQLQKNLGIQVTLNALENKAYRNELDLHASPLFDATWTADFPDPDGFMSVFLSDSGNSRTTWKNAKYDLLVQKGRQESNLKARTEIYLKLQKILQEEDVVIVPLYYEANLALVSSRAKNVKLNPLDYLYLRQVDVVP